MVFIDYDYIKASKLGIGTASYGSKVSKKQALTTMSRLKEQGINYIDTANSYGLGESEKIVGQFIHSKREQFFVSTKVGIKSTALPFYKKLLMPVARQVYALPLLKKLVHKQSVNAYHDQPYISTVAEFKKSIEESLSRLKTDYVDQLLIHNIYSVLDSPNILAFLQEYKAKGIIRQLGITTHNITEPHVFDDITKLVHLIDTLQVPFSAFPLQISSLSKINYFSVFSKSIENQVDSLELRKKIYSHQRGHFLVAMSSMKNIEKNVALFGQQ